jgi:hypothetical protein
MQALLLPCGAKFEVRSGPARPTKANHGGLPRFSVRWTVSAAAGGTRGREDRGNPGVSELASPRRRSILCTDYYLVRGDCNIRQSQEFVDSRPHHLVLKQWVVGSN